jgi:lysophospholipase L1-like esterase
MTARKASMPMTRDIRKWITEAILSVRRFAIIAVALIAWSAGAQTNLTLFMAGDSTMANKPLVPAYPERGWGQLLPLYFKSSVRVENHAMNGRSTRSFVTEKRWKAIIDKLQPGDYVIVQFGHNDEKTNNGVRVTEPFGGFKQNFERFVREVKPILATPIARRRFDKDGKFFDTHGDYPEAIRQVAKEQAVPLLELHTKTCELLKQLGPEQSIKLFNYATPGEYTKLPEGLKDDTHLNAFGATRVCDLAIEEIVVKVPELAAHLKK